MDKQLSFFGTHWKKLVRFSSPETSVEAAKALDSTKLEELVYNTISTFQEGCIQDDVLEVLNYLPYSSVTARFAALKRKGLISVNNGKRKGKSGKNQSIMKVIK
jgi:hypothetical protein